VSYSPPWNYIWLWFRSRDVCQSDLLQLTKVSVNWTIFCRIMAFCCFRIWLPSAVLTFYHSDICLQNSVETYCLQAVKNEICQTLPSWIYVRWRFWSRIVYLGWPFTDACMPNCRQSDYSNRSYSVSTIFQYSGRLPYCFYILNFGPTTQSSRLSEVAARISLVFRCVNTAIF